MLEAAPVEECLSPESGLQVMATRHASIVGIWTEFSQVDSCERCNHSSSLLRFKSILYSQANAFCCRQPESIHQWLYQHYLVKKVKDDFNFLARCGVNPMRILLVANCMTINQA